MPVVLESPEGAPFETPAEDGSNLWELLYEAMGFHQEDDEANDFALRKLCEAVCAPLQPAYDLVRERGDQPGWTVLLDPDEVPAAFLPYLAQYVGVVVTEDMDEAQIRKEIKEPTGWSRGTTASVKVAAGRGLTGTQLVIVKPRTPAPGEHYVRTLLAETPDPERTEATVRAALPAWEVLDYEAFTGMTWADVVAKYEDWAEVVSEVDTWQDLIEATP